MELTLLGIKNLTMLRILVNANGFDLCFLSCRWTMSYGLWAMNYELWVMDYEHGVSLLRLAITDIYSINKHIETILSPQLT
jgi:hypothetical protein